MTKYDISSTFNHKINRIFLIMKKDQKHQGIPISLTLWIQNEKSFVLKKKKSFY